MDPSQITTLITSQLEAIKNAPLPFAVAVIVVAVAMWAALRYLYDSQVKSLEARLKLKEDEAGDYKRKLEVASPDEAKVKVEALQQRVNDLEVELRNVGEVDYAKIFEDQIKNTKFIIDGGEL